MLTSLLKEVSRSFYLTLRVLPAQVRPQIGLAYLLARTTDTIADTEIMPIAERLRALQALRARILGQRLERLELTELARHQGTPAERILLERGEEALTILASQSAADQQLIRAVLDTITSGQELDLQRFAGASRDKIVALNNDQELDDYTYRVAGCVGEFWTKICRAHLYPKDAMDDQALLENGVRFGKGLQLVNILRDLPADLRQGRCYLPRPGLTAVGLSPQDLLDPSIEPRLRPIYDRHLDQAQRFLTAGWTYTNSLPWRGARVRLGCALPLIIGARTIAKLRSGRILDSQSRIKVTRPELRMMIMRLVVLYPLPFFWRRLFNSHSGQIGSDIRRAG